jgi:Protein of unknown function (DUF2948)
MASACKSLAKMPVRGLRCRNLLPKYQIKHKSDPENGREPAMEPLKFVVLDRDDLEVVSTHLQDATVRVADVRWRPEERRLVLAIDRFDWPSAVGDQPAFRRCRSALRFERVSACKCKHVNPAGKEEVLNLLAVEFEETDAPAGIVTLTFSGGPQLRVEVECLEAELADIGPSWETAARPAHLDKPPTAVG